MIFVFGSNEAGIHGGGAARVARLHHGAILGQGFGRQGESFAIPTCRRPTGEPNYEIPLSKVEEYVKMFIHYAFNDPTEKFKVTQIGCGLAGFTADNIAPLFRGAPKNCYFDTAWKEILGDDYNYWGTFAG